MGTEIPSLGLKCGRGVTLTTHPHLVLRLRMSRKYIPLPPSAFMACSGTKKRPIVINASKYYKKLVVHTSVILKN
jgi:hypothetical protein